MPAPAAAVEAVAPAAAVEAVAPAAAVEAVARAAAVAAADPAAAVQAAAPAAAADAPTSPVKEVDWTQWQDFLAAAVSVMVKPKQLAAIPPPVPARTKGTYSNPHAQIAALLVPPARFPRGTQPPPARVSRVAPPPIPKTAVTPVRAVEPAVTPRASLSNAERTPSQLSVRPRSGLQADRPLASKPVRTRLSVIGASFAATLVAGMCALHFLL